jgi:DNA-binding transcriptional LysR family regulator
LNDRDLVDNIRKLWLLGLISDCGSFREAAARAKVTQSALSQTISQLEALTGRVLLRRERGHVEATDHGKELLRRVEPVLAAIARIGQDERELPPIAWMSLGAFESFATAYAPELITRLQLKCPGIRLTMRVARSGALATMVRKGDLCMAVVRELDEMGRLDVMPLATDRLGFWAAAAHPASQLGWDALAECEIGALSPDSDGHPRHYARLVDAAGIKRPPMFVSDSLEALKAAAQQAALVAILPERLAAGSGLAEIRPPAGGEGLGTHRLCLISRPGCDQRENELLAAEIRETIAARGRGLHDSGGRALTGPASCPRRSEPSSTERAAGHPQK